jgi:F-type H+-transporting ATPase subunit alpha
MPVEEQVVVIFAGTNGFLDDVEIPNVRRFEKELIDFMRLRHNDVLGKIASVKELTPEINTGLKAAISNFKAQFKA